MKKFITLIIGTLCTALILQAQVRTQQTLEKGWKFTRDDKMEFVEPNFDDSKWQTVTVPHDWAIYGPFSINNDIQKIAITQDGQKEAMEHAGRTGGLPFEGPGWYRLSFDAPSFHKGKNAMLFFDGAMSHARVYVNGNEAGFWPYGYNSFTVDVTPFLKEGQKNELVVRLENESESSRWYPGAGLYRNVHLVVTEGVHVAAWGTYVTTPKVTENFAQVHLKTLLELPANVDRKLIRVDTKIIDRNNQVVATSCDKLSLYDNAQVEQMFDIANPSLWTLDHPVLYTAVSKVYEGNQLKDEYTTRFGIRTIKVVPNKGFYLNGELIKFKGVCNHHDLGMLGIAVNRAAIRRQLRILKDMGCNAIRTSHNMPAPELVRACDELGMMMMVESFDEWKAPKVSNGYHKLFDQWVEKDLVNMLHHYRNNPSVVMWCIGNEVPDQMYYATASKLARRLRDICHREDPTRLVTLGMDVPDSVVNNNMAAVLDVPGFNYRTHKYAVNYAKLPQQIILGSETASTVSSRGVYKFPVGRKSMQKYEDHQSSSYDLEHCGWSNLPEDDWIWQDTKSWCIGEFVWTGFDYLGEPSPYYTDWPSHSSLFGIIDLAGLPKDRYYLYRSRWNTKDETLHVLPHWTWPGREGEVTPIFVYTNYPTAEIFINGKSQGKRTKDLTVTVENSADSISDIQLKRQSRYRLMWMDTKYEPGCVKVVAYNEKGLAVATKEIYTAGKPDHIELTADRQVISADGKDLSFITVKIVDKDGNLCPDAQHLIYFKVKGEGFYRAGANGNSVSLEQFHLPQMHVFNGMMTAVVQSTEIAGSITLTASVKGLKRSQIRIETK